MIVMYPMLVSTTVSTDTLPAISKVLEKFILLYRMESIASRMSYYDKAGVVAGIAGMAGRAAKAGAALMASKEQDGIGELISEQDGPIARGLKKVSTAAAKTAGAITYIVGPEDKGVKGGIHFEEPKREILSLAPTYIELQHPRIGTIVLGIKVLPFTVSSEYNLLYYLSHDMSSNWLEGALKGKWREYGRMAWAVLRAIKLPIIGSPFRRSITGDPQKDIAYASTVFKHNVFCLVNYNDSISEMIKNPGTLRKMYRMGWNSLVFADDINRKAIFCMQEFQGLCSTIPYSIMGASFGKDYQQVFQGMEEVKKSSASFFSIKRPAGDYFSEHFTVDKYLDVMQEDDTSESLEPMIKRDALGKVTGMGSSILGTRITTSKKIKKGPKEERIDEEGKDKDKEDEKSESQIALL